MKKRFVTGSFIVAGLVCLLAGHVNIAKAADYYVSSSGDNSGAGSLNDPWETIGFAVNNVQPGDTVNVEGGQTYHITNPITFGIDGTPGNPITLRSHGGIAVINGGFNCEILVLQGHDFVVEGIKLEEGLKGMNFGSGSHDIMIRDVEVYHMRGGIHIGDGSENIVFDNCDIHRIQQTSTGCGNLVEVRGDPQEVTRNIVFRNCHIHDNPCHNGINFWSTEVHEEDYKVDGFLVENCDFYDIGHVCIWTNYFRVNNLVVRNSRMSDSSRGIGVTVIDSTFEGNVIGDMGMWGIFVVWMDADSSNVTIRNNHLYNFSDWAVIVDDCDGVLVTNTTHSGCSGHVYLSGGAPNRNIIQDHEDQTRIRFRHENSGDGVTFRYSDARHFDVVIESGTGATVGSLSTSGGVSERVVTVSGTTVLRIEHNGSLLSCTGECCSAGSTCGAGGAFVDSADCGMLCCIGVCDGPDLTSPTIQSVTASDPETVLVVFSEPLLQASASNPGHYAIDNGVTVSGAALGANGLVVTLTTSTLTEDVICTLTVNSVQDLATNVIEPNSQMTFHYSTAPSGLVGHWKLDEENGTVAADSSGNGNDGTVHGGATWTAGRVDGGLDLSAVDGYVEIPASNSLGDISSEITVVAWLYTSVGTRQTILERWLYDSGVDERSFVLSIEEDGTARFGLSGDGISDTWVVSSVAIPADTWTHVAAVSDGSTMRIYINGSQESNTPSAPATIFAAAADVHIGRWWADSEWYHPYSGVMDDVRIYSRALTTDELADLASGCPAGYQDCNGDPTDGCEVDITSDVDNCGSCGNQCGAEEVCSNSQCQAECDPHLESCGGSCVDLATNPFHCGACDNACDPEVACIDGSCDIGSEEEGHASPDGCGCRSGTGHGGLSGFLLMLALLALFWGLRRGSSMKGCHDLDK